MGDIKQAGLVLPRTHESAHGCVARGEEKPRSRRFDEEWLEVGNAPDVIHNHQHGSISHESSVSIDALQF